MNNIFIPSYDECRMICDYYNNFQFFESKYVIDGYNISVFAYRLIQYSEFINPIPEYPNIDALELRGITFVFNSDGSLYKRFLALRKFFNLNQTPNCQYDDLKHLKIKSVYEKMDGSLINFIELPNNKIIAKSLKGLSNEYSDISNKLYNTNPDIKKVVDWSIHNNYTPIFEYISPFNQIVIKYDISELVFLRLRDNNTGRYIDLNEYPSLSKLRYPKLFNMEWLDILNIWNLKDMEGVVVELENGLMFKSKTKDYCDKHKLTTEFIHKHNFIIEKIVKNEIDDIISNMEINNKEILNRINEISTIVTYFLQKYTTFLNKKVEEYHIIDDRKMYSITHNKMWYFSFVMKIISGEDTVKVLEEYLLKETYHYKKACVFVENKDFLNFHIS